MKNKIMKTMKKAIRMIVALLMSAVSVYLEAQFMDMVYRKTSYIDWLADWMDGALIWAVLAVIAVAVFELFYRTSGTYRIVNTNKYEIKEIYQVEFED